MTAVGDVGGVGAVSASARLEADGNWANTRATRLDVTSAPPGGYLLCVELSDATHDGLQPAAFDTVEVTGVP